MMRLESFQSFQSAWLFVLAATDAVLCNIRSLPFTQLSPCDKLKAIATGGARRA